MGVFSERALPGVIASSAVEPVSSSTIFTCGAMIFYYE